MYTSQIKMKSRIGTIYLVASDRGLSGLFWEKQDAPMVSGLSGTLPREEILAAAARQLEEYFLGKRRCFDIPFDLEGTAFQKRVWTELMRIPYGQTVSYGELAARIRSEGAARAVGTANAQNPLCVIVPCHRVINASGKLGGYSGGLERKETLLELERRNVRG